MSEGTTNRQLLVVALITATLMLAVAGIGEPKYEWVDMTMTKLKHL